MAKDDGRAGKREMANLFREVHKTLNSGEFKRRVFGVPLEDVIASVECLVEVVRIETKPTYHFDMHTPIGGPRHPSGVACIAMLTVKSGQGIQEITYPASVFIQGGDAIRAYIVKGERTGCLPEDEPPRYKPRDFRQEEKAFKLEKIVDGKVVLTYETQPE